VKDRNDTQIGMAMCWLACVVRIRCVGQEVKPYLMKDRSEYVVMHSLIQK